MNIVLTRIWVLVYVVIVYDRKESYCCMLIKELHCTTVSFFALQAKL